MTDPIEEARALLAKATPGEWFLHRDMLTSDWQVHTEGDVIALVWGSEDSTGYDVAALIVAAPRLLAALSDECERLRAELAAQKEEHKRAISDMQAHCLLMSQDLAMNISRRQVAEAALAAAMDAMPSAHVCDLIADAHRDDGGDSRHPGEVAAWLSRLDAFRAAHPTTEGGSDGE